MQIDLAAKEYSSEEADKILDALYEIYHGRSVDPLGRKELLPYLTRHGLLGLGYILHVIVQSDEMDRRVYDELREIWINRLKRQPSDDDKAEYGKLLRYFRDGAKKEIGVKIDKAEDLQRTASGFIGEGRPEDAQRLLDEGLAECIPTWQLWHEHALSFFRQERYKEALPSYKRAIELNEQDDSWLWSCEDLKWCYDHLAKQEPNAHHQGLDYFLSVVKRYPQRWIAWHECGFMAWKSGELQAAIDYYQQAISRNSDDSWVWSCDDVRWCYIHAGNWEQGYEYFVKLTGDYPRRWGAWHSRAILEWHHKGQHAEAIQSYQYAIATCTDNGWHWSWNDSGWCYNHLKRYQEAYDAHRKASVIRPDYWDAWHGMGWAMEHLAKWEDAMQCYGQALRLNDQSIWSWFGLGNCFRNSSKQNVINAWSAYRRALIAKPDFQEAKQALQELDTSNEPWIILRSLLTDRMDLDEIRVLCFDLKVDYDNLGGDKKAMKVIDLIELFSKSDRLHILIDYVRKVRPDLVPPLP